MEQQQTKKPTRFKDKDGKTIHIGDVLAVEEHPEKYVGGSYSFTGVVEQWDGKVYVTYYDTSEQESVLLSLFPVRGRTIITDADEVNDVLFTRDFCSCPEE